MLKRLLVLVTLSLICFGASQAKALIKFFGGLRVDVITDIVLTPSIFTPNLATGSTIGTLTVAQTGSATPTFSLNSGVGCTTYYTLSGSNNNTLKVATGNLRSASSTPNGLSGGTGTACLTAKTSVANPFSKNVSVIGATAFLGTINAIDYDIGGSGNAFSLGSGSCASPGSNTYRVDGTTGFVANTGDTGTVGTAPFYLTCNINLTYYQYTVNFSAIGTYVLVLSEAQSDSASPGSWGINLDGVTVASATIVSTGSGTNFQEITSTNFVVNTAGTHVIRITCNNLGGTGYCGNLTYTKGLVASTYAGPCDIVPNPSAWWGVRACGQIDLTGTQKALNITRASDSANCDVLIALSGALGNTANCTPSSNNNIAAPSFCNTTTCSVATLYDQSGHNINLTQATASLQPTLTFGCSNGQPCINFNNCTTSNSPCPNTFLMQSATISAIPQPLSMEVVAQRTGGATYNQTPFDSVSGQVELGFFSTSGQIYIYALANVPTVTATEGIPHSIVGEFSDAASASALNVDGVDTLVTLGATGGTGTTLSVGAQGDQFQHLTGNFMEAGIWPN